MNKRVLIINTGGTIGMKPTKAGFEPSPGYIQELLTTRPEFRHPDLPEFDILAYDPLLDSANMHPNDWVRIARDIQKHFDQYDGFLVLHGTDTLAYTASALSFILKNLSKPVICTGSQIPICELRSDGNRNIIDSLFILGHYVIPEVCIYFNNRLLRGNRTRKVDASHLNAFASPNFPDLGSTGIDITIKKHLLRPMPQAALKLQVIKSPVIANLQLFPGISSTFLAMVLAQPIDGLVLGTYGTGNAPNQDKKILTALEQACERGVLIVNYTQCLKGKVNMANYATGSALQQCGVISGLDMTPEAALAKLYYLLSTNMTQTQVREKITEDLRGELTR